MWPFTRKKVNNKVNNVVYDPTRPVFGMGGGWGDTIEVFGRPEMPNMRVVGWKPNKPSVGDTLIVDMESGREAIGVFTKVDKPGDPPDMFFADVVLVRYRDEL